MSNDFKIPKLEHLPNEGLLRIKQVLQFVPVSKSHWYQGVKSGKYPKSMKLSERVTVWKSSDIKAIVNGEV